MERRAVVNDGAYSHHHEVAVPRAAPLYWRLGYILLALVVMSICAGLVDGPWAAGVTYAFLLLGVGSIWRAMLPPRILERARAEEGRAVASDDAGTHNVAASPDAAIAWCGYVLVAAPVMGSCAGLADTPGAAILGYTLVLLGFAFISLAMLPPRPMERALEEERRAVGVGRGNRRGNEVVVRDAPGTMDWTGYLLVAAPVLASWAGFVEETAAGFFAFALLLLGVAFIIIAMLALAKPKVA